MPAVITFKHLDGGITGAAATPVIVSGSITPWHVGIYGHMLGWVAKRGDVTVGGVTINDGDIPCYLGNAIEEPVTHDWIFTFPANQLTLPGRYSLWVQLAYNIYQPLAQSSIRFTRG